MLLTYSLLALLTPQQPQILPGQQPGTQRWMVTFRSRPFDLQTLRKAAAAPDPASIPRAIRELQTRVKAHQAPFVDFIQSKQHGVVSDQWWLINGCVIEVDPKTLTAIRNHPMVRHLHPDRPVSRSGPIKIATNANNHAVDGLHQRGIRGAGVSVAIIDTGIDSDMAGTGRPHRAFYPDGDLSNRTGGGIGGSRILENVQLGPLAADDRMNHGTGVAAIAAGEVWSAATFADQGHAPAAKIVSYSILHNLSGGSTLATIVRAFQRATADQARHGIVAVNNSFSGSSDPTDPSQQAMDAAALHADLVVVVSAGNSGSLASNSPSAANGLAVGAVEADTRRLARFSAIGPLRTDPLRTYPDLVANGVDVVMPKRDSERAGDFYQASGTSFAAPQVCGAAVLYRSVRRAASALETKAAILATTEDVRAQNPTVPGEERNHVGVGYLRNDRLIALAEGAGTIHNGTLTPSRPEFTMSVPATQGQHYAVVVAWHRQDVTSPIWSDLDLVVESGRDLLGAGTTPRNLYEKVVFQAQDTGSVSVTVRGRRLEAASLPFSLIVVATPPQSVSGGAVAFGTGCPGTGQVPGVSVVAPQAFERSMGDLAMDVLMFRDRRQQFVFDRASLPSSFVARGMFLRLDPVLVPAPVQYWTELAIQMGHSNNGPASINRSFAGNYASSPTTVVDRRRIQLPLAPGRNASPSTWLVEIPFDRPFRFDSSGGRHMVLDVLHYGASAESPVFTYPTNGVWQRTGTPLVSWLLGTRRSATSGGSSIGRGPVVGFSVDAPGGVVPVLTASRAPRPWSYHSVELRHARPGALTTVLTGLSQTSYFGLPLPFDLGLIGAPGCNLLVSGDLLTTGTTRANGSLRVQLPIPLVPGIVQARFYQQAMVLEPTVNGFGAVLSNGLRLTVGER